MIIKLKLGLEARLLWSTNQVIFIDVRFVVDAREYCLRRTSESFQAACLKGEILVIRRALYGRMKVGKCLKGEGVMPARNLADPSFIGCYLDVTHILNRRCFGLRSCEIHGTDSDLVLEGPCYSYLRLYLEVDYECKTGKYACIFLLSSSIC